MIYWQSEKCDVRVHVHVHETPAQRTHEIFMDNGSPRRATASNCSSEPAPAHKEHKYSTSSLSLLSLSSLCQLKRTSMKAGGRSVVVVTTPEADLAIPAGLKKLTTATAFKVGKLILYCTRETASMRWKSKTDIQECPFCPVSYPILSGFLSCSIPLSSVLMAIVIVDCLILV